jgi:TatD DNase family protein
MQLFDTHSHINFSAFNNDADIVIKRALNNNTWMILVGSESKTSKRALDYANKYERGVYASIGLHPIHLTEGLVEDETQEYSFHSKVEEFSQDVYEQMASFEKVVAIGEIGLDYYHIDLKSDVRAIKKNQQDAFLKQLILANHLGLPVIIHCRQAHDDMLMILKDFKKDYNLSSSRPWGVMHCFSGDEDLAWQYFSLGLLISFTGLITFSKQWDDLIRKMPPDKFMIETDSPYMTPEPYRGQRNEPILVKFVAERIAQIKNLTIERVAEITTENARKLFKT